MALGAAAARLASSSLRRLSPLSPSPKSQSGGTHPSIRPSEKPTEMGAASSSCAAGRPSSPSPSPRRRPRIGLGGCFGGGSSAGDGGGLAAAAAAAAAASSSRALQAATRQAERAAAGLDFQPSLSAKDLRHTSEPDPRVHPSSSTISHRLRFNHLDCHENKEHALRIKDAETSGLESSSGKDAMIRGDFSNEAGNDERTSGGGVSPMAQELAEPAPDNVHIDAVFITEVSGSMSQSDFHSSLMTSERIMPGLEDGETALRRTSSRDVLSSERSDVSQSSLTSVLPATSSASSIIGESIAEATASREDTPTIFSVSHGQIGGSTVHEDIIFSNDGPERSGDSSNGETSRNHRRVLWDSFSRRGSRGYLDSDTDDLGFYSRWLDLGDDLFGDEVEEARYFHRRRHGSIRVNQYSRSRIREHRRAIFDSGNGQSTAACPLGIHQIGRCTCDAFLVAEESSARASISRIVMLTEALFEVLDEIHRQPSSLSLSMASAQAPESVVNSLPCKSYKKLETAQCSADMEQCHICLTEYEDGDQIRSLPCKHEFHLQCVDKWLKEIHRVCPLCRGDVCEGGSSS